MAHKPYDLNPSFPSRRLALTVVAALALAGALFSAAPSLASDVATLLKELEKELSALDSPVRKADPKLPSQTFKALAIPKTENPHNAALAAKLKALKARIASQRQHVAQQFAASAAVQRSHIARIAAELASPAQHPITDIKVYLDDVLVFAAEPLAALATNQATLFENTLAPRSYQLKVTGSRLVSAGDVMRLEPFTVTAPWAISAEQKRHLALLRPIVAADGKASFEVLFD